MKKGQSIQGQGTQNTEQSQRSSQGRARFQSTYYNCGRKGHIAKFCKAPKQNKSQNNSQGQG